MTIEEKLKEYILQRYSSILEFTSEANIPNSTFISSLKRGLNNSNISTVFKICNALGISPDELANGNIVPVISKNLSQENQSVETILEEAKSKLLQSDNLMLNGEPAPYDLLVSIADGIDIVIEMSKKRN